MCVCVWGDALKRISGSEGERNREWETERGAYCSIYSTYYASSSCWVPFFIMSHVPQLVYVYLSISATPPTLCPRPRLQCQSIQVCTFQLWLSKTQEISQIIIWRIESNETRAKRLSNKTQNSPDLVATIHNKYNNQNHEKYHRKTR